MRKWLATLLRKDVDAAWKSTGYTYTTPRTYDYAAAVRGARRARGQTSRGGKLPKVKASPRKLADVLVFPKLRSK